MLAAVLCGATATGKSALAVRLAKANRFEIISADSRQIYRDLSIGTNAPTPEEQAQVRHHLVGFFDASQSFSPREFPVQVHRILAAHPDTRFLLVGGTGLYLKELLYPSPFDRGPTPEAIKAQTQAKLQADGLARMHAELLALDPEGMENVHPHDMHRIVKRWENVLLTGQSYSHFTGPTVLDPHFARVPVLWLDMDREALYARIDARVRAMIAAGWPEETRRLRQRPGWEQSPGASSLGYREMAEALDGTLDLEAAARKIQKSTRNYAKRQITFFRHQFPGAQRWEPNALTAALDQCAWDWNVFRQRFLNAEIAPSEPLGTPSAP